MILTVHKYQWPLDMPQVCDIAMPIGAEILHIGNQFEGICFWTRVDSDAPSEIRRFALCGTGHVCPPDKHIGTVLLQDGNFVLHIFERTSSH